MTKIDDGGPAYPIIDVNDTDNPKTIFGLTKREAFAMAAMQGIMANVEFSKLMPVDEIPAAIAACSVEQADALIAALNKRGE